MGYLEHTRRVEPGRGGGQGHGRVETAHAQNWPKRKIEQGSKGKEVRTRYYVVVVLLCVIFTALSVWKYRALISNGSKCWLFDLLPSLFFPFLVCSFLTSPCFSRLCLFSGFLDFLILEGLPLSPSCVATFGLWPLVWRNWVSLRQPYAVIFPCHSYILKRKKDARNQGCTHETNHCISQHTRSLPGLKGRG